MKKKAQLLAAVCLAGTLAGMAPADVSAQSLWAAEEGVGTSLFADRKASKVGDILTIVPNHVCVVVNMQDRYVTVRGREIIGELPIPARGMLR